MLFVGFFEQSERLVFVVKPRVNSRREVQIDVSVGGQFLKPFGGLKRIQPPNGDRISPPNNTNNKLVLWRDSLVLIGNFVELGKSLRIHALHCICETSVGTHHGKVWI